MVNLAGGIRTNRSASQRPRRYTLAIPRNITIRPIARIRPPLVSIRRIRIIVIVRIIDQSDSTERLLQIRAREAVEYRDVRRVDRSRRFFLIVLQVRIEGRDLPVIDIYQSALQQTANNAA